MRRMKLRTCADSLVKLAHARLHKVARPSWAIVEFLKYGWLPSGKMQQRNSFMAGCDTPSNHGGGGGGAVLNNIDRGGRPYARR
jgi:hypothetical protein